MRALAALLVASAALADVAPHPRPPPRPPAECSLDADCAISTFPGCCGSCCPTEPYAESNAQLSAAMKRCAIVDCARPQCDAVRCAAASPPSQWRAVCVAGQCQRVAASADPEACGGDADCVVTEFRCCPGCCEGGPRAITQAKLAQEERLCAVEECARPDCGRRECKPHPPASAFRAQCQQSRCVLVAAQPPPPPPPSSVCRRDADCTVIYTGGRHDAACRGSPCGCCPGTTPTAVSIEQAGATPLTKSPGGGPPTPPFGLSQGQRPNCSPCPTPPPARAVCAAGQCALAPIR